jgi:Holliday junction resolvase RusA-like endonuclease
VDPRYKRYQVFKSRLRYAASAAGVAESLDPKKSYAVMLHVFWTGRARCDLDNVLKAVLDGLWRNDRRVLSVTCSALENMESESLTVWLSERA